MKFKVILLNFECFLEYFQKVINIRKQVFLPNMTEGAVFGHPKKQGVSIKPPKNGDFDGISKVPQGYKRKIKKGNFKSISKQGRNWNNSMNFSKVIKQ